MNRGALLGAALAAAFALGAAAGLAARDAEPVKAWRRGTPADASGALLALAQEQAEDGSEENLAIGRIYYLSGDKAAGKAIFDRFTGPKAEAQDWLRVGRVYWEAGEWTKAKSALDKAVQLAPRDEDVLAMVAAYYLHQGERGKGEELLARSLEIEPERFANLVRAAGAYVRVAPAE